jgi:hypothetical protein
MIASGEIIEPPKPKQAQILRDLSAMQAVAAEFSSYAGRDFAGQERSSSGTTLRGTKANTKIEPITNVPAIT